MRFFDFVRWPCWQLAWMLPVIIVVYIGALLWVFFGGKLVIDWQDE
jgi:hypothetical protein